MWVLYVILEIVKIELESRGIDLFILGVIVGLTGMFLLAFIVFACHMPFMFPWWENMYKRVGPKVYGFIVQAIGITSAIMLIGSYFMMAFGLQ